MISPKSQQKTDFQSRQYLIKSKVLQSFKVKDVNLFERFFELFWKRLPADDWSEKTDDALAGAIACVWDALNEDSAELSVRCFSPKQDDHGWQIPNSVVVIKQRDMPFLIDSLRLAMNELGVTIKLIKSTLLNAVRNAAGAVESLTDLTLDSNQANDVALVYIETDVYLDKNERETVCQKISAVLKDTAMVVDDYRPCLERAKANIENLSAYDKSDHGAGKASEAIAFLHWLCDSHFTFLGYREFDCDTSKKQKHLIERPEARLGLFKNRDDASVIEGDNFSAGMIDFYRSKDIIAFSKSSKRSSVHRPVHPDYVVVKRFDADGNIIGESRFLGLFTYSVYSEHPKGIPFIRQKFVAIINRSGLSPNSHDGKNLIRALDSFPRDELFQSDFESLYHNVMGIAGISERRVVRVFMRWDRFRKFISLLVYVPRDIYTTSIRKKIESKVGELLNSDDFDSTTHFSESILARAYIVYKLNDNSPVDIDPQRIEDSVIDVVKGWDDRFEMALTEMFSQKESSTLYRKYQKAFPISYQESFSAPQAINDVKLVESLFSGEDVAMQFSASEDEDEGYFHFKLLRREEAIELSDVIPILESLGLRVIGEVPYKIKLGDSGTVWLHSFHLKFGFPSKLDINAIAPVFEDAFSAVWRQQVENDSFNRLVLGARLHWQEVNMLRAYAAYMKQTLFAYDAEYVSGVLMTHTEITRNLVALFKSVFDPRLCDKAESSDVRSTRLQEKILSDLETVQNINEDKIFRRYFDLIKATLRTNYFIKDDGDKKAYCLALKINPKALSDIPEPKPSFEIFVFSARMEGVHLRTSSVARGGLRWSDRLQDYRTEVLGLVKAQQVKNAVIVPSGAKGGFVCKQLNSVMDREAFLKEGVECYKLFISSLLDITDNYVNGDIVTPKSVVRKDEPDPYFVVAADKGTATFSDIANNISLEYGHWLGDAFASGGSQGYDHKGMGITAKGAWVSVQRHFRELGIDVQKDTITVVGIGDMSGDVFGNGMLLSNKLALVAAFNHLHIFIDPQPNVETAFEERKRLFALGRSQWTDYDSSLISQGGGIFSRESKAIKLTPEMKSVFGFEQDTFTPTELIQNLLKSKVDLLWNGGIGTYVKSSSETHAEVGDKANDSLRVNGNELKCRVVGEGGNLGLTQRGRIEYSLAGGLCNTDFIDNAAGVDCSDHEVNIKILLKKLIDDQILAVDDRNELLASMTEEVSASVLQDNYEQTGALSMAAFSARERFGDYKRFIVFLEKQAGLKRGLEFLPTEEALSERKSKGLTFTRPELAVLLSYAKVFLKEKLIHERLAEDSYIIRYALNAFPPTLVKRYEKHIFDHQLVNEIVGTQVANDFVNNLGIVAIHRLMDSTGAPIKQITKAYLAADKIFNLSQFKSKLTAFDFKIESHKQYDLTIKLVMRVKRAIRWFLAFRRSELDIQSEINHFSGEVEELHTILQSYLDEALVSEWQCESQSMEKIGLNDKLAKFISAPSHLFTFLSVVEVSHNMSLDLKAASRVFVSLYSCLNIRKLSLSLAHFHVENYWQASAREGLFDDMEYHLKKLAEGFVQSDNFSGKQTSTDDCLAWINQETGSGSFNRWQERVTEISENSSPDFTMYTLAVRELAELSKNLVSD